MDFSLKQDGGSVRRDGHQRHGGLMKTPVSRPSSVTTSIVVYGENAFWANWGLTHSTTILPVLSPVLMIRPRALLNPGPQTDFLDRIGLIADSLCGSWCESAPLIETNASSRLVAPVRTPWIQVSRPQHRNTGHRQVCRGGATSWLRFKTAFNGRGTELPTWCVCA